MSLIKSKERVAQHGEVFTPAWMVTDMLDLVKNESERIDARFLEPACGSGNFLVQILQRKLATVELNYRKNRFCEALGTFSKVSSLAKLSTEELQHNLWHTYTAALMQAVLKMERQRIRDGAEIKPFRSADSLPMNQALLKQQRASLRLPTSPN